MNIIHRHASNHGQLLDEVSRTTASLDTVYSLYALAVVAALGLWAVGVLAFGKGSSGLGNDA